MSKSSTISGVSNAGAKKEVSTESRDSARTLKNGLNGSDGADSMATTQMLPAEPSGDTAAATAGRKHRNLKEEDMDPFSVRLRAVLRPEDTEGDKVVKRRNPKMRKLIRETLGISDTTLHFWLYPGTKPSGRKNSLRPSVTQVTQIAMLVADEEKKKRDDVIAEFKILAGFKTGNASTESSSSTAPVNLQKKDVDEKKTDLLLGLRDEAKKMISPLLPSSLPPSSAAVAMGCFYSQQLLDELTNEWKEDGRGGHVIFFWRWRKGGILRYLRGTSLESFKKYFEGLIDKSAAGKLQITIFLVLEGDTLDASQQDRMVEALKKLGRKVCNQNTLTFYVEGTATPKRHELFEMGILVSRVKTIPFIMVDYPDLYSSFNTFSDAERLVMQNDFNPIMWSVHATILDPSIVPDYLNERRIEPVNTGEPLAILDDSRWKKVLLLSSETSDSSL